MNKNKEKKKRKYNQLFVVKLLLSLGRKQTFFIKSGATKST
jgi:hypothetical protein